jgi:hypothetical protein
VAGTSRDPGLEETSDLPGALRRDTNEGERTDCGSERNKRPRIREVGSRSAFILPLRAGNWTHWDPKEEREAS